ncbi:muskelin isoform X1 [Acyrthosiphon pisum]|uniref:LisH domain-containing protein n=2 Tax=Acyrthosiphon pisum TaxID=7029 RepID=A0A8R2A5A5_ACYPI|nr:muskelin isoform X1 [Acyrthosiphon pisum]|eukprot:XP_001951423.2 PREDICTED: muskelin isoform X1 [Acyrthosiphon pisum]
MDEPSTSSDLCKKLSYSIHSYSSYLPTYVPENILHDNQEDQSSRWSSMSNSPPQYLILKLQNTSIVKYIKFGKYERPHVCNLKRFKVYGGLGEDTKIELLYSGLNNNSDLEIFNLRHTLDNDSMIPVRYIRLEPLESWGSNFNYSLWYVELLGIDDSHIISSEITRFYQLREETLIRLCLKHFRQKHYDLAANVLLQNSHITLEHPFLSQLYDTIVKQGNYEMAETLMDQAINDGFLEGFMKSQSFKPIWNLVKEHDNPGKRRPCMRGGHQMCIDSADGMIYLLGGWDGHKDLSDLWCFTIATSTWRCISINVEEHGGPSPRSCHKICIDMDRKQIFVLGRFYEVQSFIGDYPQSDFYVYDIEQSQWTLICADTNIMGGPKLLFDHQMVMDSISSTIYVFGGRVVASSTRCSSDETHKNNPDFSGFYKYHVPTNTWTCILPDTFHEIKVQDGLLTHNPQTVASRGGHSILLHSKMRRIYIFGGQRQRWAQKCPEFLWYDIETGVTQSMPMPSTVDKPPMGYTQRATIDMDHDEIYVLSSLSKDKDRREDKVQNAFWVYFIKQNKWICIYKNHNSDEQYWNRMQHLEPCPRFAYQLVYDQKNKTHYLFGGNPGRPDAQNLRLDDFWELKVYRCTNTELSSQCKLLIRKFKFQEIKKKDKVAAMQFLQTSVSELIDHSDIEQTREFQGTAALLFKDDNQTGDFSEQIHKWRCSLFDKLCEFFPNSMVQPKDNLVDLIPL